MGKIRSVAVGEHRWTSRKTVICLALAAQLIVLGAAFWYAENLPSRPPVQRLLVSEVLVPEDVVFQDTDVAPKAGKQLPPIEIKKVSAGSPEQVRQGATLFGQHCSSCHGGGGRGDGAAAASMNPKPRNLTVLRDWKGGTRMSEVFRTVTGGLKGTAMPAFDYLTHEQRFALAHFVASLATGRPSDTPDSLARLDLDFSLGAGAKEPNIIPVSRAVERMIAEAPNFGEPSTLQPNSEGGALFVSVVLPGQAPIVRTVLEKDPSWRSNASRLREIAMANIGQNGFAPRAAQLDQAGWTSLLAFLNEKWPGAVVVRPSPAPNQELQRTNPGI